MTNIVKSSADNGSAARGPSGGVWRDCPWEKIMFDPNMGVHYFKEFLDAPFTTPTSAANWGEGLVGFTSTNGVFVPSTPVVDGVLTIGSSSAIDNDAAVLVQNNPAFQIVSTRGPLWFEARVKFNAITDTQYDAFIGLCEKLTPSATLPITATAGTLADKNLIGFHRPGNARSGAGSGGGIVRFTYKADGQAVQGTSTDFSSIVADTWIKLGFKFTGGSTGVLRTYVNGTETGDPLTVANIAAATFPNDMVLGLAMAVVHTATVTNTAMSVDWVRIAQRTLDND